MRAKAVFLRASTSPGRPDFAFEEHPLELVVPYTDSVMAAGALAAAAQLAQGFEAAITLIAVHIVPFPAPLECQPGIRKRLERELTAVARTSPIAVRVKLVFARDRADALLGLLGRGSLVVMGIKRRWWRTREERLAQRLAAAGHGIALIRVK
jgi:hypothetical protein